MEINKKIHSDLKTLNEYNKEYSWIPNEYQIRPTEMLINMKKNLMDKIEKEYNSTRDYILIQLFYKNGEIVDGKLKVKEENIKLNKFDVCRFRYQIDPQSFHYIMWYTCSKETLTEEEINNDIKKEIYNIIKSDNYSFIWYENPNMTIDDIYHVQVFWVKN